MSLTEFTEDELKDLEEEVTLPLYALFPLGTLGLYSLAFPWPSIPFLSHSRVLSSYVLPVLLLIASPFL